MQRLALFFLLLSCCGAILLGALQLHAADPPTTGPLTEARFPPLKLPPGFKATLFACDPFVEYPSVIAVGPRPGTVFVAVDYMTGLGTEIIRRDEIRLLEDTDRDGFADKSTVVAGGFNSIMGLAWNDGTLFVMHAPFLTALRFSETDQAAGDRRDLLSGLGLPPEENPVRLHCANGVTVGHDGWLYLALGDHGCNVPRPEGDKLVLEGGGILRCRKDGTDLHVFATGLRNIYDVALDEDLNVFVRDNENDGGTYKQRVYHSFFGADHGYPYLYDNHPHEALPPLVDVGLGSSAGGVCYLETQFPPEYRGNLFFCEWGRSVVHYALQPKASAFASPQQQEFAVGADNDSYPFKPTDVVVERDGALIVSDWADGQRPNRGRARIYRITYSSQDQGNKPNDIEAEGTSIGLATQIARLDSESYSERCSAQSSLEHRGPDGLAEVLQAIREKRLAVRGMLHAIWIVAELGGESAVEQLFGIAESHVDSRVKAQAIRALADLVDPVLVNHRLDAQPGDAKIAARIAALTQEGHARVLLETINALGRLQWVESPDWLRKNLENSDEAVKHAAAQTLRRAKNWPAVVTWLDAGDATLRQIALVALAERFEPEVVDGLLERLRSDSNASHRREYVELLSRVYKKPGSWVYWGYRPPPRPANTLAWERTEAIESASNESLADADLSVRFAALKQMQREKIPTSLKALTDWLQKDRQPDHVAAILAALNVQPEGESQAVVATVIRNASHSSENRSRALAIFASRLSPVTAGKLVDLMKTLEDGPVLAEAILSASKYPQLAMGPMLLEKARSSNSEVRAAAVEVLAGFRSEQAKEAALVLLSDQDTQVRRAAVIAAGKLNLRESVDPLLKLARDPNPPIRAASLDSLRLLHEPRVLPFAVAALADRETVAPALNCIRDLGGPEQFAVIADLARRSPSSDNLTAVVRILDAWSQRSGLSDAQRLQIQNALADVQGANGAILRWSVSGPWGKEYVTHFSKMQGMEEFTDKLKSMTWRVEFASSTDARVRLASDKTSDSGYFTFAEIIEPALAEAEFTGSSNGTLQVWHNGRSVYRRAQPSAFRPDSDRFAVSLQPGVNRFLVSVTATKDAPEFQLRFRRKSSKIEHEQLTRAALERSGNSDRGRALFLNAEKSQCVKCHRIGEQGERIGPELTGVGGRFSRIYLIDSILDPSRTIAPSFETITLEMASGQIVSGVKIAESESALTLADNQGKKHTIALADIDQRHPQRTSTMPEGLEKRLTSEEFIDLLAFLMSQREQRKP